VVELARYLFALAPAAEVAVCRAIDARGHLAGFGDFAIADKAIERRSLPSAAAVAWNRARGRAAMAAIAAASETDYFRAASTIIVDAERLVHRAGSSWVRGQRPSKQLVAAAIALAEAANRLAPPPVVVDSVDDRGDYDVGDPVSFLGTMIANNLFPNLFGGERVAPLIPQLIEQVDKVARAEYWRLLGQPPLSELARLRDALVDLHAVAAEAARGKARCQCGGARCTSARRDADAGDCQPSGAGTREGRLRGDGTPTRRRTAVAHVAERRLPHPRRGADDLRLAAER
jgi:hypothetical protein